jgi:diacylglycerol O-acyltransferase
VWVDDAGFDIGRHVRSRPLPAGGAEDALVAACVELTDRPFDLAHPLWQIWLFTGPAEDGHAAVLVRFHHVLADGSAALLLLGTLFDTAPDAARPDAPQWMVRPVPTRSELLLDVLRRRRTAFRRTVDTARHPRPSLASVHTFVRQARQLAREGRAPRTSFNQPVGAQHRVLLVRAGLDQVKQVAHAHHATVNDVVLCMIAGGARALLTGRGEPLPPALKVSVAASVRAPADTAQAGNLVGVLLVPLPVAEQDPIRRLERTAHATAERKRLPPYQPAAPLIQRGMIRLMRRQRRINLLMSNLAGPAVPLYFVGAKVVEVFQIGVVQGNVAIQVGALSYAGQLNIDVVGDTDIVPDLAVFAAGMADDLERLVTGPSAG